MNWDDLRYVLAVADHGSVSAAARHLGVTHATVLRRVASFEAAHGGDVFDKSHSGYRVREGRQRVIEAAREVAAAMGSVDRLMHGIQAPLRGRVLISSTDSFCQHILPPAVLRIQEAAPELRLELLSSNQYVEFAPTQADISVRPTPALPDDMTGDIVGELALGAYSLPGFDGDWLGLHGPLTRSAPARWLAKTAPDAAVSSASDSFLVLARLAALGLGVAALPVFLGDTTPGLERRPDLMPEFRVPVWVATHVDLAESPRIRLVRQHLAAFLTGISAQLAGEAPLSSPESEVRNTNE